MKHKSPVKHVVKAHKREGAPVKQHVRGHGTKIGKTMPAFGSAHDAYKYRVYFEDLKVGQKYLIKTTGDEFSKLAGKPIKLIMRVIKLDKKNNEEVTYTALERVKNAGIEDSGPQRDISVGDEMISYGEFDDKFFSATLVSRSSQERERIADEERQKKVEERERRERAERGSREYKLELDKVQAAVTNAAGKMNDEELYNYFYALFDVLPDYWKLNTREEAMSHIKNYVKSGYGLGHGTYSEWGQELNPDTGNWRKHNKHIKPIWLRDKSKIQCPGCGSTKIVVVDDEIFGGEIKKCAQCKLNFGRTGKA